MAKGAYLGIGDTARKVKNIYVGAGINTYQKTVAATEFQQGALLYSSGNLDTSFTDYVSTTNFYEASYGNVVKIISSKVTPLEDSGFLWYDSNYNFISGNKGTVSRKFVSGEPPVNTAYFKFNLNSSGVTPSTASGTGIAVYSVARKIKKAYIGDANGLARLCYSAGIPFASGTITTTSASKTLTISDLPFTPTFAVIMYKCNTSNYGGLLGVHGNNSFYDNYGYANMSFSTDVTITYGTNSVTITNNATSSFRNVYFHKGTYSYIILGANTDNENVAYGTQSISYGTNSMTVSGLSFTPNRGMCYFYDSYGSNNYANTAMIRGQNLRTVAFDAGEDYSALKEISSSGAITFASGSATFSGTPSYKLTPQRACTAYYVVWREE